jgi:hypothetical protein
MCVGLGRVKNSFVEVVMSRFSKASYVQAGLLLLLLLLSESSEKALAFFGCYCRFGQPPCFTIDVTNPDLQKTVAGVMNVTAPDYHQLISGDCQSKLRGKDEFFAYCYGKLMGAWILLTCKKGEEPTNFLKGLSQLDANKQCPDRFGTDGDWTTVAVLAVIVGLCAVSCLVGRPCPAAEKREQGQHLLGGRSSI